MAQGDIVIFDSAIVNIGNDWDMNADTFNYAIVDNTTTPTRDTAAPHWGGTGTTNFSTWQVSTGGTSYTGPVALSGLSWSEAAANTFRLDFSDITQLAQDASGFTNGYWMILYNNTDANKRCLCAYDLGGPISLVGGTFDFSFNVNGVFQIT